MNLTKGLDISSDKGSVLVRRKSSCEPLLELSPTEKVGVLEEGKSSPETRTSSVSLDIDCKTRMSEEKFNDTLLEQDNSAIEERYRKIVDILGDEAHGKWISTKVLQKVKDVPDTPGALNGIDFLKLKTVIKRLKNENSTMMHTISNAIPVFGSNGNYKEEDKELFTELDMLETKHNNGMSMKEFKMYIAKNKESPLIKYFSAIAEAKKVYMSPTQVFIPLVALAIIIIYILQTSRTHLIQQLQFDTRKTDETWRYISYSLAHANLEHILLNVFLLVSVGCGLEAVHGTARVAVLYVLGVVSSALAFYCFASGSLVGCSGGVYCLLAASLSNTILNWKEDRAILIRFTRRRAPRAFSGKMYQIVKLAGLLTFGALDFGSAAWRKYQDKDDGVSVIAHIFGFLTGLLVGFTLLVDEREERWEKRLKFVCWTGYCLGMGLALGANVMGSSHQ